MTEDELSYSLKRKLRIPPEQRYQQRYQQKKANWFFHELSVYMKDLCPVDGYGCTNLGCIPECRSATGIHVFKYVSPTQVILK